MSAILIAAIGALGFAILIAHLSPSFVTTRLTQQVVFAAAFAAAMIVLLGWFQAVSSHQARMHRFRTLAMAQFIAFGVLGILVSLRSALALLP